jgi:hypothetical protein
MKRWLWLSERSTRLCSPSFPVFVPLSFFSRTASRLSLADTRQSHRHPYHCCSSATPLLNQSNSPLIPLSPHYHSLDYPHSTLSTCLSSLAAWCSSSLSSPSSLPHSPSVTSRALGLPTRSLAYFGPPTRERRVRSTPTLAVLPVRSSPSPAFIVRTLY